MEQTQIIDTKHFHDYVGNGTNEVEFMIDLFIQQSKIYCTELEIAYQHDDSDEWHDVAHKFKGMAGFTGAAILYQTCQNAQQHYQSPKNQKITLLNKIHKDVDDAITFFKNYKDQD